MQRIIFSTLICILALAGLLAGPAALAGSVYTWTDADGVKRYSNSPPPEGAEHVQTSKEYEHDAAEADRIREEYDRMVEDAAWEADKHFRSQAREKARKDADQQEAREIEQKKRIDAQRAALERQIEALKQRGISPTFSQGMRDNLIKQIQDQIDQLESGGDY